MPEFDDLAQNYHAGFDDPIKGLLGCNARAFLKPKIERLLSFAQRHFGRRNKLRYLDFGCGTGDFLAEVSAQLLNWSCEGCDVSEGMLREARRRFPDQSLWNAAAAAWPKAAYDLVSVVCVLHHVPPCDRLATLDRIAETIVPGGLLVVFEHNPWNPFTRWMVGRTEVDRNAELLSCTATRNLLENVGFQKISHEFLLFFPPRLSALSPLERWLLNLPLGGQFVVTGEKARLITKGTE
jgi:SAM-dependent methyltransferase